MSRATPNQDTLFRLEGGLLPADLFNQVDARQLNGQSPADYWIPKGLELRDEIGRYWRIASNIWQSYAKQRQRQDLDDEKAAAQKWMQDLLINAFGFNDLEAYTNPREINERQFPITHNAFSGAVPVVLCAPGERALDTASPAFGQEGRRRSPTGLLQEYLNANDQALWGLVSDGERVRILRDNPSMTRPAYIELDLATLFTEERLPDFRRLWLLLHASRFAPEKRGGEQTPNTCWLEQWREQAEEQGERLLDKLRVGVTEALKALGSGFLAHPDNIALRQAFENQELDAQAYYQELLRLVYRLLFVLRAEARDLLHPEESEPLARERYHEGYSLDLLRQKARVIHHAESRHHDLWLTLQQTLNGLANGQPLLALPALGGIFDPDQCTNLDNALIDNRSLLAAIHALTWHHSEATQTLVATDYANMDAEELGSVYEALLELTPAITQSPWQFRFIGIDDGESTAGNLRKLTGSYYTPDELVQSLIETALKPVIQQRLQDNPEQPRASLLDLRVVDPACGSGHFLLAATRTLAREVAQLDAGDSEPTPEQFQHALREVVQNCIFGVDVNPMAVELCRTALWMEALEPGKPLTFLDSHIQTGNALVGIFNTQVLESGIPNEAFNALEGDDNKLLKELRKENKDQGKNLAVDLRIQTQELAEVEHLPEDSLEEIEAKRERWHQLQDSSTNRKARLLEDLWTAAFFISKTEETKHLIVTNGSLKAANRGELDPGVEAEINRVANENHFFHWPLQFPEVFNRNPQGFDVVLGNPPWEMLQFDPKEYFTSRAPEIAEAKHMAERDRMIEALSETRPEIYQRFLKDRNAVLRTQSFVHGSGRFPRTSRGRINLAPLFAELATRLHNEQGRAGVIVPSGIATDSFTQYFFRHLVEDARIHSLYDFENRKGIFKGVHRSYKFSLLTLMNRAEHSRLQFFSTETSQIGDSDRLFSLTPDEFKLINPNTMTCPIFRSNHDAKLTKRLYRTSPVLLREENGESAEENPWGVDFMLMFMMNTASFLFNTYTELEQAGAHIENNQFISHNKRYLPLYEAKMVHHYDHRFATYEANGTSIRDVDEFEKQDPNFAPVPRYWVDEWEVVLRTADAPRPILDGLKKNDERKLEKALRSWLAGQLMLKGEPNRASGLLGTQVIKQNTTGNLFGEVKDTKAGMEARQFAESHLMTAEELEQWLDRFESSSHYFSILETLLPDRCPKYLLGFRDIGRSTDERTFISASIPWTAVGNKYPLLLVPSNWDKKQIAALQGNLSSIPLDYVVRQKVGGTTLNFFIVKQFPVLPPETYQASDLHFIADRVLELNYTSHDMAPFAKDLGYDGPPFDWDPDRRHKLRCELDAYYAHLYGLTRDELRYILDPADLLGPEYPSVTFPSLKRKEIAEFGEYRTQRRVLEAFDELAPQFTTDKEALA